MTSALPRISTPAPPRQPGPDIIGLGALNIDYIASASRLSERLAERVTESASRFEWNHEGPVDEQDILEAMDRLGTASLVSSLGGSAWITIFSLAQMRIGVTLGYVGIMGHMVKPGLSFLGQMDQLGIDRTWVANRPGRPCGLCLSYINDTDRVMLIHPGANFEMYEYLQENAAEIASYLASARYVHVTSFLDKRTPTEMWNVLASAKNLNSALQISFDPGYDWASHPYEAIEGILGLSDLLFLNYREFKELGKYAHGESDDIIAERILQRCAYGCRIFVAKRYDFVEVFRIVPQGVIVNKFQLQRALRETEIEDATGAGDVFAAAVLASLTSRRLQLELGGYLGLSLARYKLSRDVPSDIAPDLSRGFLQQTESLARNAVQPTAVLIMCDDDRYRHQVQRFITERCHLSVQEWRSGRMAANDLISELDRELSHCSFAVCLLGDDASGAGSRKRANQDAVHQAGILQGRYGFGRVALLIEEGCDMFSNLAGLIRLDFPVGRVETTFLELERMLQREGVMGKRGD